MTEAETISKEAIFTLTLEQEMTATHIINKFVEQTVEIITPLENSIAGTVRERVIIVCKDLDNAGIPKQLISTLVCQKADNFDRSSDWLRRLIPAEYKNQAQREISLTRADSTKNLPGSRQDCQHEVPTIQVKDPEDLQVLDDNDKVQKSVQSPLKQRLDELNQRYRELEQKHEKLLKSTKGKRIQNLEQRFARQEEILKEYKQKFEDNYKTEFLKLSSENDILKKNYDKSKHYCRILFQVYDNPDTSDAMIAHIIKDFVNDWYPKQGVEIRKQLEQEPEYSEPKEYDIIESKVKAANELEVKHKELAEYAMARNQKISKSDSNLKLQESKPVLKDNQIMKIREESQKISEMVLKKRQENLESLVKDLRTHNVPEEQLREHIIKETKGLLSRKEVEEVLNPKPEKKITKASNSKKSTNKPKKN